GELPPRAGGDVRMAVTVGVEWLAKTKAELAVRDVAREAPSDAPAGSGRGARNRGVGDVWEDREKCGREDRRTCASPAPACRRRARRHMQQPTHLSVTLHWFASPKPTGGSLWRTPSVPAPLLRSTKLPREAVCAVAYSQLLNEETSSWHCCRG